MKTPASPRAPAMRRRRIYSLLLLYVPVALIIATILGVLSWGFKDALAAPQEAVADVNLFQLRRVPGISETIFTDQRAVLVAAIKDGQASGVMQGPVAEHFTREFRSTGVLRVSAAVIGRLPRADCRQLRLSFVKEGVPTPIGFTEARLNTQLHYCLDGGPPLGGG